MNPDSQYYVFHADLKQPITDIPDARIDPTNSVIYGASLITGGLEARGHGLEVDQTTLTQIKLCADEKGQVSVKTDHGSGAFAINGYLTNFRIVDKKVVGDWHLLKNHPQNGHILEMAQRMPRNVGLSVAFMGLPESEKGQKVFRGEDADPKWAGKFYTVGANGQKIEFTGKKFARCDELVSADLVVQPAANPDGLFSARVDNRRTGMAKANLTNGGGEGEAQEPSLAQVIEMLQGINQRLDSIEDWQDAQLDEQADEGEEGLEGEGEEGFEGEGDGEFEGEGEGEMVGAGAGEGRGFQAGTIGATLNQFATELNRMKQREVNLARQAEIAQQEQAFEVITAKIDEVTHFAEELAEVNARQAEYITELQAQIRTGKIGAGAENATIFNSRPTDNMTAFEARVLELTKAGKTRGEAVTFAEKEDKDRHYQHLVAKGIIAGAE